MTNPDDVQVASLLDRARDALSVGRVFGAPITQGDVVVIPVARVAGGGGGGSGSGPGGEGEPDHGNGNGHEHEHEHGGGRGEHEHRHGPGAEAGPGSGAGGGFGGVATPVGVYVIRDGQVSWEPAVRPERLALAGMALTAFALWVLRSVLRSRSAVSR